MSRETTAAAGADRAVHRAASQLLTALAALLLVACGGGGGGSPATVGRGIVLDRASLATVEDGADGTFRVSLATAPTDDVTVQLCSGDETEGKLYVATDPWVSRCVTVTFGIADWNVLKTIHVQPQRDMTIDGNQSYQVTASIYVSLDLDYATVPDRTLTVTNGDADVAGLTLSKVEASTDESPTTDQFTVMLTTMPTADVKVTVTSADPSEGLLLGGDSPSVAKASITLTFTKGSWHWVLPVTVVGQADFEDDGNRTYLVTVASPTGAPEYAGVAAQTVQVTNVDLDTAGITVAAGTTPLVTSENGTTAELSVRLNTRPAADVVIPVTSGKPAEGLLSSGATNGVATLALTFTASNWNLPQSVVVTGQDDTAAPVAGDLVAYDVAVGPASGDALYAALAAKTVPVLNVDNDTPLLVVPAAGGAPLQTRESAPGASATFTVALNKVPAGAVVVPVSVGDPSEGLLLGGDSPTTPASVVNLTFTPGDFQTPKTVTVVGQADATADGNQAYSVTAGPPTGDATYAGVAAVAVPVVNADTDVAGFTLSKTTLSHTEGGAATSFTVVLNVKPDGDVVIPVTSGDATEGLVEGGNSVGTFVQSLQLTFTPTDWQTPQTVQVKGPTDTRDDGNQVYAISVGPTQSVSVPYAGLPAATIQATNVDVDYAGVIVAPPTDNTTEAGKTVAISVTLRTIPTGTVTVPVTVDDVTEGKISTAASPTPGASAQLVFTPETWNVPQIVTVTGQDDALLDGTQLIILHFGPTTGDDAVYNALQRQGASLLNLDDEVGVNEGTAATPVALTAGAARLSQVGPSGESHYVVSAPPGTSLSVSVANLSTSASLTIDDDGDFAAGILYGPKNLSVYTGARIGGWAIATVPAGGSLHLRVTTSSSMGCGYTLFVTPTYTFASGDVPKAIPDADGTTAVSSLVVSGATPLITQVNVRLNLTHPDVRYLYVTLVSPAGTSVTLSSFLNKSGANFTDTVFDSTAPTSIYDASASPPFTGTFRPYDPLGRFSSQDANGTWELRVQDFTAGGAGNVNSWSLEIH